MRSAAVAFPLLRHHPANARSRADYSGVELAALTASIRELGLLQPLVVTPDGDAYTMLAGHRRDPLKETDTVAGFVESLAGQDHPHDRAAALVGKSTSWIRDRLRLWALSPA